MKQLIFIFFLGLSCLCVGQDISVENTIKAQIQKFETALIQKDTQQIELLLDHSLTLGHSNGWIENKSSLLKDLSASKVVYQKFLAIGEVEFTYTSDNLVITRRDVDAYGTLSNTEFIALLNILEIWKNNDGNWQLLARQSVNRKAKKP